MSDMETDAIRATVADYVTGMCYGDTAILEAAFHPGAASVGHYGGVLEWQGVAEFAASCVTEALERTAELPPWEIEKIDLSGDTAVAIVTNVWAGERFRDILTLLKTESGWRIVFKAFHHLG